MGKQHHGWRAPLLLVVTAVLGCGGQPALQRQAATSPVARAPTPGGAATESEPTTTTTAPTGLESLLDACRWWDAAEARRQPTVYCTTEDDPVPTANGGFPALARDGAHVAVIQVGYDCCSDFGTVSAEVRDLSNTVVAEWSLSDRDADGVEDVSGQQVEARISELNALLFADGFRPLAVVAESEENLTQPLSLANGLSARLENLSFEVRRGTDVVASLAFSSYERDSDCCDGGLGRGGRCHLPPALVGVWQGERAIVVSVGLVHQRDGCDASPSFHVLSLPAD